MGLCQIINFPVFTSSSASHFTLCTCSDRNSFHLKVWPETCVKWWLHTSVLWTSLTSHMTELSLTYNMADLFLKLNPVWNFQCLNCYTHPLLFWSDPKSLLSCWLWKWRQEAKTSLTNLSFSCSAVIQAWASSTGNLDLKNCLSAMAVITKVPLCTRWCMPRASGTSSHDRTETNSWKLFGRISNKVHV